MDTADNAYNLRLAGAGISVDMSIDRAKALRILTIVLSDEEITTDSGAVNQNQGRANERSMSLREFLDKSEASKKPEQILAIAQYMCELENANDVGKEEIKSRFALAREPLPANYHRDFAAALRSAWLAPVHGKADRYYVTRTGAQALEAKFKVTARRGVSAKKRAARNVE